MLNALYYHKYMKIIIGSESFTPNISGVAISTELLAENLSKIGHEIYVFSPSETYRTDWEKYKKFQILRLKSIPNPFRKGFRVAALSKKDIAKAVERIKPDVIHLQGPTSICSGLKAIAKRKKIPLVIINHFSLDYVISYLRWLKPIHPIIKKILTAYLVKFYNSCDEVICPTETVKQELSKWGIKTPITAISNGVDLARFFSYSSPVSIRLKFHLPMNPIVLYVGRIDKDKSIEVLMKAMPKVIKETNAHFVIAGIGDELPKIKKMAEEMGMEQVIHFLGRVDHQSSDLEEIYQISTVFAIPSAIETQSIVTLEAMAAGLPIVAANAGALPELVKNGENGYLFKPGDSDLMAKDIITILSDEKLIEKMKKRSLEIISDHQASKSFEKVEEVYEKVIQENQK